MALLIVIFKVIISDEIIVANAKELPKYAFPVNVEEYYNSVLQRNLDLSNVTIRVTYPEGDLTQGEITFENFTLPNGQVSLRPKGGMGGEILSSLQLALRFKIEVITAKYWARQFPNGSWFGMAQQVLDNQADLSVARTGIMPNRAKAFQYLIPVHALNLYAFFVQPLSFSGHNIFLEPFTPTVWLTLLFICLLLILSIHLISFILMDQRTRTSIVIPLQEGDTTLLTKEPVIWILYAICQHGFYSRPKLTCLRIVIISGVVLGYVMYSYYSAKVLSKFTIQTLPIKSFEELMKLRESEMELVIDENNALARGMIEGTNTSIDPQSKSTSMMLRSHVVNQKRKLSTAKDGSWNVFHSTPGGVPLFAFITYIDIFYTALKNTLKPSTSKREICERVANVPVTGGRSMSGWFVRKGSFLKEPFNIKIALLYTSGIMSRIIKNYERTYDPQCTYTPSSTIVELEQVLIVFQGLFITFAVCIVSCILEYFKYSCRCNKKRKGIFR